MVRLETKIEKVPQSSNSYNIYYLIVKGSETRRVDTNLCIFKEEWNSKTGVLLLKGNRKQYLIFIKDCLRHDLIIFNNILREVGDKSIDTIFSFFINRMDKRYLGIFMRNVIIGYFHVGRIRSFETYMSAYRSFYRFRQANDILLSDINAEILMSYQLYLNRCGLSKNTISFYMRTLRALYNIAVRHGMIVDKSPFKRVYTGVDKTIKRALPLNQIKKIKNAEFKNISGLEFARDLFMFSFYTRGMSFVDMAYLKKSDIQNGILVYKRRKTGQKLYIRWEPCMQVIINKYSVNSSDYLLPIIRNLNQDERIQYRRVMSFVNSKLKIIGKFLNMEHPLTMYVARHSWASIAQSKNVPLSVISQAMGHDSERTTRIYLSSLEASLVDKANRIILNSL